MSKRGKTRREAIGKLLTAKLRGKLRRLSTNYKIPYPVSFIGWLMLEVPYVSPLCCQFPLLMP